MLVALRSPLFIWLTSLLAMWLSAEVGTRYFKRIKLEDEEQVQFNLILGGTLTLLGLLVGFSFSMAIGRYDQRKNYEEEEANAIGTEYLRADLLSSDDAANVQRLLAKYVSLRIMFYESQNKAQIQRINSDTAELQNGMWSIVKRAAQTQPTPPIALVVSGMNDVINSQGYTQAAWWNRIPIAAWYLMEVVAVCCNLLLGFATRHGPQRDRNVLLFILPFVLSIALFLLADLDSPRGGLIKVHPQNLISLSRSLHS
jgi:hypothetical protein